MKGAADREFELSSRISFTLQRLYNEHIFFVPLQATAESRVKLVFTFYLQQNNLLNRLLHLLQATRLKTTLIQAL